MKGPLWKQGPSRGKPHDKEEGGAAFGGPTRDDGKEKPYFVLSARMMSFTRASFALRIKSAVFCFYSGDSSLILGWVYP